MSSFQSFMLAPKTVATVKQESIASIVQPKPKERRTLPAPFYINKLPLFSSLPPETRRWIHDSTDERAAIEHGCRYSEARGAYVVNWIEKNCILYEGSNAGEYMSVEDWQWHLFMQFGWLWFSQDWAVKTGKEELGWVRRFRVISGWVPKKNAKSPTLAAGGLYCFAADGERGNKCYSVALDKNQAEIAHNHALEFVRANPEAFSYCKINATTKTIEDLRTKSKYLIKAGSNAKDRNRNEGLNGYLFVDEVHVVEEGQMKILERAGISRRNWLKLQLSTSGTNIAGYGFKQCQIGRQNRINADEGRAFNFRFLHIEYSCPQDVSTDDLRDEIKIKDYIKMANPTLGRIVMMDEALNDWQMSCSNDTELMTFAMYRLNLWSASGGKYIPTSDWNRCKKLFKLADMKQYPAVIGCDFSRKRDMVCLMLMFAVPTEVSVPIDPLDPDSDTEVQELNIPHIHPYFLLPKAAVSRYKNNINFENFAERKQLTIVNQQAIRPETIAAMLDDLINRYDVRCVGSDNAYSTDVATLLSSKYGHETSGETSIFAFISQTAQAIGPAVEQLQNLVLNQEIVHRGHPVLDWQLSHLQIVEDSNGNRRFEKPTADNYKKIDGWSALANGIYCMMCTPDMYPGQLFIKA